MNTVLPLVDTHIHYFLAENHDAQMLKRVRLLYTARQKLRYQITLFITFKKEEDDEEAASKQN